MKLCDPSLTREMSHDKALYKSSYFTLTTSFPALTDVLATSGGNAVTMTAGFNFQHGVSYSYRISVLYINNVS